METEVQERTLSVWKPLAFIGILVVFMLLMIVFKDDITRNSKDGESCPVRMVADQPVIDCYGNYEFYPEVFDF